MIARSLALAAGVITVLLTSRILGPNDRGHLAAFVVLQLIAAVGLGAGTGPAAYVQVGRGGQGPPLITGAVLTWAGLVVLGSAAAFWLIDKAGLAPTLLGNSMELILPVFAIGAGGQYLATSLTQLVIGLGRPVAAALGYAAPPVLIAVATVFTALAAPTMEAFMAAQSAAWVVGSLLLLVVVGIRPSFGLASLRRLVKRGGAAAIGEVANALSYRLDTLIVGVLAGASAIGVYSLAVQVLEPLWIIASAGAGGLLVRYRHVDPSVWQSETSRAALTVVGLTAVGVVTALLLLPAVISGVGDEYSGSFGAAVALAPGIICLAGSKILAAFQTGSGRLWLGSAIATTSVIITTTGDLLLVPMFGVVGASAASSAGYAVSLVLWAVAFRRLRSAQDTFSSTTAQ